jgi:hypothetical protein
MAELCAPSGQVLLQIRHMVQASAQLLVLLNTEWSGWQCIRLQENDTDLICTYQAQVNE